MCEVESRFEKLTGEDFDESFLAKIYELDTKVYPKKYWGTLENYKKRFAIERRTFVCIKDKETGNLVGYINFLPITKGLWKLITETAAALIDDEISGDQLVPFTTTYDKNSPKDAGYNLFILSVAIHKDYRGSKDAICSLNDGFRDYLCKLNDEGYKIHAVAGTAVSEDGMKFMRERFFYWKREVEDLEEGSKDNVFILEGELLEKFLDGESNRYKKTYKNDLYMIVPFSCNENGLTGFWCNDEEEKKASELKPEENDDASIMTRKLLTCLKEDLIYECAPEMTENIKHYYLGSCNFLFSYDEYPSFEEKDKLKTYFYGEERAHLVMMADTVNKLFNLLIFIPDSRFSPSAAQDEMSQSFLPVRDISGEQIPKDEELSFLKHNKNKYAGLPDKYVDGKKVEYGVSDIEYFDLYQVINHLYGLIPCGHGKTLVCASEKPKNAELGCMLAGETYMSIHQDFRINSSIFGLRAQREKVVYDYYDIYLSERAVVFVEKPKKGQKSLFEPIIEEGKDKEDDDVKKERLENRIELITTYTFIMEVVTFRNTALQKMTEKVSAAILQDGDVSYTYLQTLYKDFAGTDKYANKRNFKYFGTQKEAEAILDAFKTSELEADYHDKQSFLESYIELSSANRSKLTTTIVGLAATLMSMFGLKEIFGEVIEPFAKAHGVPLAGDTALFYKLVIAVFLFYLLITVIMYFRDRKRREENLIETYKRKYYYLKDEPVVKDEPDKEEGGRK